MKRFAIVIGTAVLGLSALTACGGGDDKPTSASNNGTSQSAPGAKLATADVSSFGKVVVDGTGRTLYVFDQDTANPSKSNCDGDCAVKCSPDPVRLRSTGWTPLWPAP